MKENGVREERKSSNYFIHDQGNATITISLSPLEGFETGEAQPAASSSWTPPHERDKTGGET